jgi:putative DNA primase/helicase
MQPIDFDAARQFIAALGKPNDLVRLRAFYPTSDPRKVDDRGAKGPPTKQLVESWVADGRGIYVVINNGGDKDADITECIALFCEWDDRPKDWQVTAWRELGLPEPTIQVDTGGKSIHSYWVLSSPMPPSEWRVLQTRLLEYADADRTLKNASRVMRLPGAPNPETGDLAQTIHISNTRHTPDEIAACLPAEQQQQQIAKSRTFKDYKPETIDEIKRALAYIPPAVPQHDQYPTYRNILWGLIRACEEAGESALTAAALMKAHSPLFKEVDQCAASSFREINASTFWYFARDNGYRQPRTIKEGPPELRQSPAPSRPADNLPFRPLGFDHGIFYYLPVAARQVVSLTAAQHNQSHFLMLASLKWWLDGFGDEKGRVDWASAQDAVMSSCIAQGVYDPSRVRGRGAWADSDRVILHLGNRLVIDGRSSPITKLPGNFNSYYFYENAKAIDGPDGDILSDDTAAKFQAIAQRFRWEAPASANLILGWTVLAPVCGALNWRPHIWITGGAGTGKTTILRDFMKPMLGGMFEGATGGTTEAGLRGQLRSDAIPVVFDELEQNEQKDKQVVQNILALARIASSEGGKIYKGTTNGGSNTFEIRSMFCVSSINVALVQRADLDRFCVLPLRKDYMDKNDWIHFEQQILEVCTEENGRQLVSRTLKQIPVIRKNAKTIAAALARRFGQRFGDQYGTLLAGAWTLMPRGGGELTADQAHKWIEGMDWETSEIDSTDADEMKCLNQVLQALILVEGGRRMTILELAQLAKAGVLYLQNSRLENTEEIESVLGRYGVKVFDDGMAIANSSTNLQALLRDTPWSGNAYRQALRRIPGACPTKTSIRFKGTGVARATLVPWESVETVERA